MNGSTICFDYNGRWVIGEILNDKPKNIDLKLHTDYKGKNVFWEEGETKIFEKSLMKNIIILK